MNQNTIAKEVSISGIGIHTAAKSTITLCPAKENSGVIFQRVDLESKPIVEAKFKNVYSTNRSTSIKNGNAEVKTIEHLLASISAFGIDNLLIKINNIEVPILDGSSKMFYKILKESGIKKQKIKKKIFKIRRKILIDIKETGATYLVEPSSKKNINIQLDYDKKYLKNQIAELEDINNFEDEISSCRTFSFLSEVEPLIKSDLIKGGDLDNSVIIIDDHASDDIQHYLNKKFGKENLTFEIGKLLNKKKLIFDNEPARHKLLDFIGDTFLLGFDLQAKITCFKPGHKSNLEFVKKLCKIMIEDNRKTAPEINFDEKPHYDLNQIKKILPHREPFIFIDEIRELGEEHIIGVKYVKK